MFKNTCTFLTLGFSYTLKFLKSSLAPDSLSFPNLESVRQQCAFLFFGQRRGTSEVIFAKQDFNTLEMLLPNFSLFFVKFSSRYFLSVKFFFLVEKELFFIVWKTLGILLFVLYKYSFHR